MFHMPPSCTASLVYRTLDANFRLTSVGCYPASRHVPVLGGLLLWDNFPGEYETQVGDETLALVCRRYRIKRLCRGEVGLLGSCSLFKLKQLKEGL